jgi:DnaK suppressor protein
MKKSFLKQIKQKLIAQKAEILEKCKRHNSEIDSFGDEIDHIQARVIALADAQLASRDKDNLAKIEATLKRIEDKTFGECQECNEDIDEKRLMINPSFITCIGCAEHLEALKRKHGG